MDLSFKYPGRRLDFGALRGFFMSLKKLMVSIFGPMNRSKEESHFYLLHDIYRTDRR
jgi:hypothetical protein